MAKSPALVGETSSQALDVIIRPDDLDALATQAGLQHASGVNLALMAEAASHALNTFGYADSARNNAPSPAERRDWCRRIESHAKALLRELGCRQDGRASQALSLLQINPWKTDPESKTDKVLLDRLRDFAGRAASAPEQQAFLGQARPSQSTVPVVMEMELRDLLPPLLSALELLAERAERIHAAQIGPRRPQRAKRALFRDLAVLYDKLFGRLPTVTTRSGNSPGGASMKWFTALLEMTSARAKTMLCAHGGTASARTPLHCLALLNPEARGPSTGRHALADLIKHGKVDAFDYLDKQKANVNQRRQQPQQSQSRGE